MHFCIAVPFADAEYHTMIWAQQERQIDFRRQPLEAVRCTTAFAATELNYYLSQSCPGLPISFCARLDENAYGLELAIEDPLGASCGFTLEPTRNGLRIFGDNRTWLLYGVYEFLRL